MIKSKTLEIFQVRCFSCNGMVEIKAFREDIQSWQNGELIQNALPYLTGAEREILISGTCGPCFDKMFAS